RRPSPEDVHGVCHRTRPSVPDMWVTVAPGPRPARIGSVFGPAGPRSALTGWGPVPRMLKKGRMLIDTFQTGPLGCNCSLVIDETSRKAIVIDPGGDFDEIRARLEQAKATVTAIVHTHTHIDHVGATAPLSRWSGAPARIHEADRLLYDLL